jgi:hypothetical protein
MTDIWAGNENCPNGAFLLAHNFGFFYRIGRPSGLPPSLERRGRLASGPDAYQFYLGLDPIGPASGRLMPRDSAPVWHEFVPHVT